MILQANADRPLASAIMAVVTGRTDEAEGVVSFELSACDGAGLPAFSAGAHIDVHLPNGLVRQYSLFNSLKTPENYAIAVLREPNSRGGSAAMHDLIMVGDTLPISSPRNHFPLLPADRYILFAGGIGITPILCMAEHLAAVGAEFELHYCARFRERMAFRERLATGGFASSVHLHFDDGPANQKLDFAQVLAGSRDESRLYVCGPQGFIDLAVQAAAAGGWSSDHVHREYFAAASPPVSTGDKAFQFEIASTGELIDVAADEPAITALRRAGFKIQMSCEQGVCGTCVTRFLSGTVIHRDSFLMDDEHLDQMTPCVSRANGGVIRLDL